MVNPANSSLLAAQIYSHASQVGGSTDTRTRSAPTPNQQRSDASRTFPTDQVEMRGAVSDVEKTERTDKADVRFDASRPGEAAHEGEARAFAREAPGTAGPRALPPGSHLDLRV